MKRKIAPPAPTAQPLAGDASDTTLIRREVGLGTPVSPVVELYPRPLAQPSTGDDMATTVRWTDVGLGILVQLSPSQCRIVLK